MVVLWIYLFCAWVGLAYDSGLKLVTFSYLNTLNLLVMRLDLINKW